MSIRDRLENWAEAARWGAIGSHGTCIGSLEGRYRPPRREDEDELKRRIKPEPDFKDAELINEAWLALPRLDRLFLKFLYVDNAAIGFICRRCSVRRGVKMAFELHRARVEKKLEERLVNPEFQAHNIVTI